MKITFNHREYKHGYPVPMDKSGNVLEHKEAIKKGRKLLGLSVKGFAELCNVSPRTVESWEQGKIKKPPASVLNVLKVELEKKG